MTWSSEILRSLGQLCYWRDYRYADRLGGSALTYANDVIARQPLIKANGDLDDCEGYTWHERWYGGFHETRTGRYVFTTPQPHRYKAAVDFIAEAGLIAAIAIAPHMASIEGACPNAG
ncbi:MAG: hypothetical protein KDE25_02895 [Novosphingobium sp.]|nr:hypothetical protein [Novosphingobium sp.]